MKPGGKRQRCLRSCHLETSQDPSLAFTLEASVGLWQFPMFAAQDQTKLLADLERAGFRQIPGGKGSHRKFLHPRHPGFVLISGHDGDDARHYQEKQDRNALRQVQS